MRNLAFQGINIQYPISIEILEGVKTIETRTYSIPKKFINKPLWLIETPGKRGNFKARAVAIIVFGQSFSYQSRNEFYKDFKKHRVSRNSPWAWKDVAKWGWPIQSVKIIKKPFQVPAKRGLVFTAELKMPLR
jgi:hypothetical protein